MVTSPSGPTTEVFRVTPRSAPILVSELRSRSDVLAAGTASTRSLPTDVLRPAGLLPDGEWGYRRIGGPDLARVGSGTGVVVAVLDTGVDGSHKELSGRVLPGRDFVDENGDARRDPNGHGTHVAGIIAAASDGTGMTGVAPAATILPVRVLGPDGVGDDAWLALGIVWAVDNGADILNLSVGGAVPSTLLEDSITYALDRGVLVVVSAGNDGAFSNQPSYPAAYASAFAVGATDVSDRRSMFSNTGNYLDVAAPGSWIRSTWPGGGYQLLSGTSMAAPFVSGAAALVLERTGLTGRDLATRLAGSAIDLGPSGPDAEFGSGLVNPLSVIGVLPPPVESSTPTLPPLPQRPPPVLPSPVLPVLPTPTLPVPALPTPTHPTPTLPVVPVLTPPPALQPSPAPSVPTSPSTPVVGSKRFAVEIVVRTSKAGRQRVLDITLNGPSALVSLRTLEVTMRGRTLLVKTNWKGSARVRVLPGTVRIHLPGSSLHAGALSDVKVR